MFRRWFLDHPHSVGESYLKHQRTALGFGVELIAAGAACLVHALCPRLFEHTASRAITRLNARMNARLHHEARGEHLHPARFP